MRIASTAKIAVAAAVAANALVLAGVVLAHERRDVGAYHFVVGFIVEPALEGVKNGVDLRVTDPATQRPVEGLEDSLEVEVTPF